MEDCLRCDQEAELLQPLPPGVLTKERIHALGDANNIEEIVVCEECIIELQEA